MSTNTELAKIFERMAVVLELLGENRFRSAAYARGARAMEELAEDVKPLAEDLKALTALDGIGKGLAADIQEYVATGHVAELEKKLGQVPPGVLKLLDIPGVGPKTAAMLWKQGGVTDLQTLKAKLQSGELAALPRMGEKTLENLSKNVDFTQQAATRYRLGEAMAMACYFVQELSKLRCVEQAKYAGSIRRGKDTIGDVDILVACHDVEQVVKTFTKLPVVRQVLGSGQTKCSVRVEGGMQVDLRIVRGDRFGAALAYFTGSKEHNVALRERAIRMGFRLNEYGLWKAAEVEDDEDPVLSDAEPVAAATEADIHKALGLQFIPPTIREGGREIAAAEKGQIPRLVEIADIKAELHAHTTASDGSLSIEQLAELAMERGYHTLAVTDHSVSQTIANGLSIQRLREHIEAVRKVAGKLKNLTLLAGSEVDILPDGKMDYPNNLLKELDIVVASPHAALSQEPKKATARLIKAIENPYVHIVGHPTGRLIGRRAGLEPDMKQVIEAAARTGTALEINANSWRLDLRDSHARAAMAAGVKLAINTDAHRPGDFDMLMFGVMTAQRAWATPGDVINCLGRAELGAWIKAKRKTMGM